MEPSRFDGGCTGFRMLGLVIVLDYTEPGLGLIPGGSCLLITGDNYVYLCCSIICVVYVLFSFSSALRTELEPPRVFIITSFWWRCDEFLLLSRAP